ncbi:transposase [Hyella patelloides LEGE 07179]|uniref:Transposase n=1 Tax=Hyella patelloides LEGE 07179 TaxID=945734 RepID=A0A563VRK1_9CYAN|nr:transposase [Hyella patelloides LEGE 07179]
MGCSQIIEVYETEDISIRKLAQRFQVAKSFIQKLLKQYQETKDISPKIQGGSPPTKLQGEQLIALIEIIESNNDATLVELCDLLQEKTGIRVSRSTMGRITLQLNYSVKKNSSRSRKRKRKSSEKAI